MAYDRIAREAIEEIKKIIFDAEEIPLTFTSGIVTPEGDIDDYVISKTEYINVNEFDVYTVEKIYRRSNNLIIFYDESKTYLSSHKYSASQQASVDNYSFIVPKNAKYMRFNVTEANTSKAKLYLIKSRHEFLNDIYTGSFENGTLYSDGTISTSDVIKHSDYINVNTNYCYRVEYVYPATVFCIMMYDADKKYVGSAKTKSSGSSVASFEFNTPSNCSYVRFNVTASNESKAKLYSVVRTFDKQTSEEKSFVTDILSATLHRLGKPFDKVKSTHEPLCVIIDDDCNSMYQINKFFELCTANNIVGTYACITRWLDEVEGIEDKLYEYERYGFQVVVHCNRQTEIYNPASTSWDARSMEEDMVKACHRMSQTKFCDWKHWVLPYGSISDDHKRVARRLGMKSCYTVPNLDYVKYGGEYGRLGIPRMELYPEDEGHNQTLADIKTNMLKCANDNGLIIVCTHMYQWDEATADFERFNEMISYGKQVGLKFTTISDAFEIFKPVFDFYDMF